MPPNGPQSEMAFEIKFAVLQFCNLLFMLICLHLRGQRHWQHWTWEPGRKSSTKIQEIKPGLNHIRCIKVGLFIKQGKSRLNVWERIPTGKMTGCWWRSWCLSQVPEKQWLGDVGIICKSQCRGQAWFPPASCLLIVGVTIGTCQEVSSFRNLASRRWG